MPGKQLPVSETIANLNLEPPILAVEFVRAMRGTTRPNLLRCSDGEYYIVKSADNLSSRQILGRGLFVSLLALRIGLPICRPAIVEVPFGLTEAPDGFKDGTRSSAKHRAFTLQLGSAYPGHPGEMVVVDFLPDKLLRRVRNLTDAFLGGLAFDLWTCNCGRREAVFTRMALNESSDYSAWLSDYGGCLSQGAVGGTDEQEMCLYSRRVVYETARGLDSFEPYLIRIENLTACDIESCAAQVPPEWGGGKSSELRRLANRAFRSRADIRRLILKAKLSNANLFPNWR